MARLTRLRATPKSAGQRHDVIVMTGPAPSPLRRLGRLVSGRNELRRPSNRIEAAVIVSLIAAFLTAAVGAACFTWHL